MDSETTDFATRCWTPEERDLWQRISAHRFETPDIALDLTRRLARTLGWSIETARAGLQEYRRFCFLAVVTSGAPVTPSEEVDEIWHLHLTYTRDYWDRWCGVTLARKLHHDPTSGGADENRKYRAQYADTLALYESYFGPPPTAFWPGTAKRFAARPRYRMIDGDRAFVLPRPSFRRLRLPGLAALLALLTTPAAAADSWNPLDWPGDAFLMLFVCLVACAALASMLLRDMIRATGRPADLRGLSPVAMASLTGGVARAADTLFLELAARDAASLAEARIKIERTQGSLPPELERFRADLEGSWTRKAFVAAFKKSTPFAKMRAALIQRNAVLDAGRQGTLRLVEILPVGLVIALGVTKICVGLSRERPVGILVFLCVIASLGIVWALARERYLTREGAAAMDALRTQFDRAARAPRDEELALAFALGGAAVLIGTEHAAYAKMVQASPGGGDGGGCGGSGCGGGGCGGCSS